MGLYGVLGSALSGLQATQAGLDLVARNVANADTPGYTKKTLDQDAIVSGGSFAGVRIGEATRQLDLLVQRQLRAEMSGAGYVRTLSGYYEHLDMLFGAPGSAAGLDTVFNEFLGSLEALTTSPESFTTRDQLLRDAEVLAQTLNQTSTDIQAMRLEAERGIGDAVTRVNELLAQIANINNELGARPQGSAPADLLDIRDRHINELSGLLDLRVVEKEHGQVALFTRSGTLLLDLEPAQLIFDERGTMNPQAVYSPDAAERNVGTISLRSPNGLVIDLINDRAIRSGELAALIEMRDRHLVNAQAQLDAFAASMAQALSARRIEGEPVSVGAQSGFDLDLSAMLPGDRMSLTYSVGGIEQSVTIVRVDDPSALPLDGSAVPAGGGRVIGIDFSAGFAAAAADIASELGPELQVQDQGGGVLRFLDDGAADTSSISSASASVTATGFSDGGLGLPFFIDAAGGGTAYSGSLDGLPQQTGFAGRITVNPALFADNSKLITYAAGTPIGDPARPTELLRRLTEAEQTYAGSLGIAGNVSYSGTVAGFVQRVIAHQGGKAADVARGLAAQDTVVAQLEERFSAKSGVNIDEEMARLIELQTAFQANTRVVQAFREMMALLMQL